MQIEYAERAVYLPTFETLVLSDLHAGAEESENLQMPLGEQEYLEEHLLTLLSWYTPSTLVIAGDIMHKFGRRSDSATETVESVVQLGNNAGSEVVLVRGNHDPMLDTLRLPGATVVDEWMMGDNEVLVIHGHEAPRSKADLFVLGHHHPMLSIEGIKQDCFLYGESVYWGDDILVLPRFNEFVGGHVMNRAGKEKPMTYVFGGVPVSNLRPVIIDDMSEEPLEFPPLGELQRFL
jgi:putative SbcD/Mre11-related phosphoesterase